MICETVHLLPVWKLLEIPFPPINFGALTDTPDGPRGITSYINPSVYQKELTSLTNRARLLPSSRTIASKFCVVVEYKE